MSLKKICSCRFFVPVETSTRSPFRMAGTRYASVLPVPVPASASSTPPRSNASATAAAISIWPARGSKSATAPVSGPPSANAALAASTRLQDCRIAELREGSNEPLRSFLPSCNSAILQFCNLRVGIQRESAAQSLHLGADHREGPVVLGCLQRARDEIADGRHFGLAHAARRHRGRADANAACHHGRILIERNRVLVDGDARLSQRRFGDLARDPLREH